MILTDDRGRPIERPPVPPVDATGDQVVGWLRAMCAYDDAVRSRASSAFDRAFRRSVRP